LGYFNLIVSNFSVGSYFNNFKFTLILLINTFRFKRHKNFFFFLYIFFGYFNYLWGKFVHIYARVCVVTFFYFFYFSRCVLFFFFIFYYYF